MAATHSSPTVVRPTGASLLAGAAALLVLAGCGAQPEPASSVAAPTRSSHVGQRPVAHPSARAVPADPPGLLHDSRADRVTVADGRLPAGVSVFDDRFPAVSRLDPDLLAALREAAKEAAQHGIEIDVNSGWRSRSYQEQLFAQAVAEYGSAAKAARWVARPGTSVHEAGAAADLGPATATRWLATHGAALGLCQVYRNEPWHYELRPDAVDRGCPAMYADPASDPRMHQ